MTRSAPLLVILCLQAILLFSALDLLPIWTDELFTVTTVSRPIREIIPIVQRDIHPPLYYILLREWGKLPLPFAGVAALRAFSALWALAATALLDTFWTRHWKPVERWLALAIFALSPCLLLYGRMARSYTMQTALALLCIGLLLRWMKDPRSVPRALWALASIISLLYTHYVPGLAVLAGFVLTAWPTLGLIRVAAFSSAALVGYLPWIATLLDALRKWGGGRGFGANYALSGNAFLEQIVKIGYGLVSLTIGESFLAWSLLLIPVILLLAAAGARAPEFSRQFLAWMATAAAIGYIGVARWTSYPFIPARVLWLLPFLALAVALGISRMHRPNLRAALIAAILASYISSTVLYFRRENFLNLGYAAPLPEIAAKLNRDAQPHDLILIDNYNTDSAVILSQLSGLTPALILDRRGASDVRRRIAASTTVWIVRNTRDISPEHITTKLQAEACAGRIERDTLLEPFAPWQQFAMKLAGFHPPLTHFYQLTECAPAPRPEPNH